MLLSETIKIKLAPRTVEYYEGKGYTIPKVYNKRYKRGILDKENPYIDVKIEDAPSNCRGEVTCLCDYCLEEGKETIVTKPFVAYNRSREKIAKDCCDDVECMKKKREESNLLKYGKKSVMQVPEVIEKYSKSRRKDFDEIRNTFDNRGYTLLTKEDEYINCEQKLKYICLKHKDKGIQDITWHDFNSRCGCYYCGEEIKKEKKAYSIEFVREQFDKYGFILLTDEYIDNHTPMPYICKKHKDKGIQYKSLTKVMNGQGCKWCGIEKVSGENCVHWKGGVTSIYIALRGILYDIDWHKSSYIKYKNKCFITGIKSYELDLHHKYSFNKIINDILNELGLPIMKDIKDYNIEEWLRIKEKFIKYHQENLGVPILPEVHKLYHKIYGDDNNEKQFNEFILRFDNHEFDDLLKEYNIFFSKEAI